MKKRVFVWLFGIATLVLILAVRAKYNEINGTGPRPPAPVAQVPAPAAKAALTSAAPEQAKALVADETFMGLPLGSDEKAILEKFSSQVKKLDERQKFAFTYADYFIPGFEMDGIPMDVYFQMDNDSHRLTQVLLRNMVDDKPPGFYQIDFNTLNGFRTAAYGFPQVTEQGDPKATYRQQMSWVRGRTAIELTRSQIKRANGSMNEMLTLRFAQPD
jgi:hypothetical protein